MKKALKGAQINCTDIGCYALGVQSPLKIGDLLICMGASVGAACGMSKVQERPVVAIVGDSTFFHASIPGLINAVYNNHRIVLIVLDNYATAMTGFQPHPGTGFTGVIRLIVNKPELARKALEVFPESIMQVVVVPITAQVSVSKIANLLGSKKVNIDYAYTSAIPINGNLALILRVNDVERTEKILKENSIEVLTQKDFE